MNSTVAMVGARLRRLFVRIGWLCLLSLSLLSAPLLALPSPGPDGDVSVWLEARLLQGDSRYVGQEQRLQIDLLTPHWFRKAPKLEPLSVPALVVISPTSATSITIRREGRQYSGLRYEFRLYPQQAGIFRLPALKVSAWPATPGAATGGAQAVTLDSPALVFQAARLPGDTSETPALVARELQLQQRFSVPQGELQPGMLLRREITLGVPDLPGHLIPALELQSLPGDNLRLYQAPPRFNEQRNRGTLQGQRIEQHSYLLTAAGRVQIPALRLRWWNSEREQWQLSELPGRLFDVAAGPQASAVETPVVSVSPGDLVAVALLAALVVAVLALGLYRVRKPGQGRGAEQIRAANSLIRKGEAGQWASVIRAFYHWLDLKASTRADAEKRIARIGDCSAGLQPLMQRLVRLKYDRPAADHRPGLNTAMAADAAESDDARAQRPKTTGEPEPPIDFVALQRGLRREVRQLAAPEPRTGPLPALYPHSGRNRPRRGSD